MDKEELKNDGIFKEEDMLNDDIFKEEDMLKEDIHIELIKIEKKLKDAIKDFYKNDKYKRNPFFKEPRCVFGLYDLNNKNRCGVTFLTATKEKKSTVFTTDSTVILYLKQMYDDLLDIADEEGKPITKSLYINSVAYSMLHEMVHWYQANYGFYDGTKLNSDGYNYRELLCCQDAYKISKEMKDDESLNLLKNFAVCAMHEQYEEMKEDEK